MNFFLCLTLFALPLLTTQEPCTTPPDWSINFDNFVLGDNQFANGIERCSGLEWINATSDNWKTVENAVSLDKKCPDVICRCLNCGDGKEGQKYQSFPGSVSTSIYCTFKA